MSDVKSKNTKDLIQSLSDELIPVRCMKHPFLRVLPWFIFAGVYVAASIVYLGMRGDMFEKLADPYFVFEMVMMFALSISAALASVWLCVPDMRGQKWMLAVPLTLFSGFIVWTALRFNMERYSMPDVHWHKCMTEAIIFGLIPGIAMSVLSMRGKTTRPFTLAFMNALSIGGLGYIGLRITCGSENIGHISFYHIFPYMVFGIIISMIGRYIYRW